MGLKDSLKRLFSTSKKVGTEKVENSIDQAKEFAKEKTGKLEEVVDEAKENMKEFARETSEKVKDIGEKVHEKAEETKDTIEAKVDEVWEKFEEKAVTVVDNLEAKIRGAEPEIEPVIDATVIGDGTVEPATEATEPIVDEALPDQEKTEEAKKA